MMRRPPSGPAPRDGEPGGQRPPKRPRVAPGLAFVATCATAAAAGCACLHWGPNYLDNLADRFLDRLASTDHVKLLRFLHNTEFGWGSGCSGTDSPTWVFGPLSAKLESRGCHVSFPHIFSAELEASKRNFICQTSTPGNLYGNLYDLCKDRAFCHKAGAEALVDPNHRVRIFIAGFSCKTVSGLHSDKGVASVCIDESTGSTGLTFSGVVLFLRKRSPHLFVLENVVGLGRSGQLAAAKTRLEASGYVVFTVTLDPLTVGVPQSRPRIYIIGYSSDKWPRAKAFNERDLHEITTQLEQGHPLMNIEEFVYEESHPRVHARRARFLDRVMAGDTATATEGRNLKWVHAQRRLQQKATAHPLSSSSWDPKSLRLLYPEAECLPSREKGLLDMRGIGFPHHRFELLNISQTDASGGPDFAPTITPSGRFWLADRCRRLLGVEALALQGIHVDPDAIECDDELLHNLAGNAFNTASCMEALVATLVLLARMHYHDSQEAIDAPVTVAPSSESAARLAAGELLSESDSDSELWRP